MRKVCASVNAPRTASLIAADDARSWPNGFSSARRVDGRASPDAASPAIVASNSDGAVDRKIDRVS